MKTELRDTENRLYKGRWRQSIQTFSDTVHLAQCGMPVSLPQPIRTSTPIEYSNGTAVGD